MKNRNIQWLFEELPGLVGQGVLTPEAADKVRQHYGPVQTGAGRRWALVVFGVLGAALIGAGIILLLASNWEDLSRPVRAALSFAPLVLAQAVASYVLLRQMDSLAWREGAGVFWALSIGASIALVAQTYHIAGDFAAFMLTWSLAGLPIVYLLNSSTAAMLYWVGVTTWAGSLDWPREGTVWFWPLIALAIPHLCQAVRQSRYQARVGWLVWVLTSCGAFGMTFGLPGRWDDCWIPAFTSYYGALYLIGSRWFDEGRSFWQRPFQTVGALGGIVVAVMLTFEYPWEDFWRQARWTEWPTTAVEWVGLGVLAAAVLGALALWADAWRRKEPVALFFGALPVVGLVGTALVVVHAVAVALLLMNLYTLGLGVTLIGLGVRDRRLGVVNLGLLVTSVLIIARFFDSDLSFVFRGLAFIGVGIGFLITNYLLIRKMRGVA